MGEGERMGQKGSEGEEERGREGGETWKAMDKYDVLSDQKKQLSTPVQPVRVK